MQVVPQSPQAGGGAAVASDAGKLLLVARDKAKHVVCPVIRRTLDVHGRPVAEGSPDQYAVVEPLVFYRLPDGECSCDVSSSFHWPFRTVDRIDGWWTASCADSAGTWWLEFHELLDVGQASRRASAAGAARLALPEDVKPERELLRDVCCQHARCAPLGSRRSPPRTRIAGAPGP